MQKKKFTQTETFQIAKHFAKSVAFGAGVVLGVAAVEVAVRKIMK